MTIDEKSLAALDAYFKQWQQIAERVRAQVTPVFKVQEPLQKSLGPIIEAQKAFQKALEPILTEQNRWRKFVETQLLVWNAAPLGGLKCQHHSET